MRQLLAVVLRVDERDNVLVVFPSLLRILPGDRAVKIDKKSVSAIRPSHLVAVLKANQDKRSRFAPEQFLGALYKAFLAIRAGRDTVPLTDIYEAFTLLPGASAEYDQSDFGRDIYLLDISGLTETKSGARFTVIAPSSAKGGRGTFTFVGSDGETKLYYEQLLVGKQQLFDEIVDDVSLDLASRLNAGELFGLFGLEPPQAGSRRPDGRPTGLELEARCERILANRGWRVERTARTHDGGVDLIAVKTDMVGIEQTLHVQCKDHARHAGVEVVRELLGVLPPGQVVRAVIAAPGGLTAEASSLARLRGVTVWDEEALRRLEDEIQEEAAG